MCGLAGFLGGYGTCPPAQWPTLLQQMGDAIRHRGPDDSGVWIDEQTGVGLVHRRLSILDLSSAGHQPMMSANKRYVIAFNGEIYNHLELKRELGSSAWRGHSDTEIMLAGIEAWGLEATLEKSIGMFAISLWDQQMRTLTLARDRMGEKPLYYGWQGKTFLFASELKALRVHPAWQGEVNRDALTLLMRYSYIPAPYSIFRGIYKLLPGTVLTLSVSDLLLGHCPSPRAYWCVSEVAQRGIGSELDCSDQSAADQLEGLLRDSVHQQMVSDVPLGVFLSGGIDSSTVAAVMQAESSRPVHTFSIGFYEDSYNEAKHAKAVAQHLGTDHTELYVTSEQALAVIPELPRLYDEPFSDSSQIPTFLVSEMARKHVTVALSGDGGDELFGGYNRYVIGQSLWDRMQPFPLSLRQWGGRAIRRLSPSHWDRLSFLVPESVRPVHIGDKLHKLAGVFGARTSDELYKGLVSHWDNSSSLVHQGQELGTVLDDQSRWPPLSDFTQRMIYLDMVSYLPDDILVKVDRAAMGVSLETRAPFLDHRLVEFSWRVPLQMKVRNGQGKWLLRQVLYRHVPQQLIERPKMGFGVPIDKWLRGPLRGWAEDLLDESRLRQEGFFDPNPIRQKWSEHLSGRRNWQHHLWDVLMFQAWLQEQ